MRRRIKNTPKASITNVKQNIDSHQEGYEETRRRSLALLNQGVDLGTQGHPTWRREDLHER